ncbi:DUF323 domain-containing protein [Lentinula edodes]|uniref:DUF323 domain-containing protein n=1 Tax=Lentinula edodes TaxID=5353 RepID=UPI001E8D97B3|nr:DUF323 domain-containing protein [Lentinula edodes]KAH7876131.1 DUF323 domain-containing protein [Lentinula edodes]
MPAEIVDVQTSENLRAIQLQILDGLQRPAGQKNLPTMLLYDERGLRLYDDITTMAPEYYLFGAEEDILKKHATDIVMAMHNTTGCIPGETVIELGAGSLRKTSHILRSLSHIVDSPSRVPPITYYALDLEKRELERTLNAIAISDIGSDLKGKVETKGMWGTYDDGLKYLKSTGLYAPTAIDRPSRLEASMRFDARDLSPSSTTSGSDSSGAHVFDVSPPSTPEEVQAPLHIMFLGSSLGNFNRKDGAAFLHSLPLRPGSGDTLLLGLDHANEKDLIEEAYNDPRNHTKKFIMNGLRGAGRALGNETLFLEDKWDYVNRYDDIERRHEAFYKSKISQVLRIPDGDISVEFQENELVKVEESWKFSETDAYTLFSESNLRPIERWIDSTSRYSLWLLERPAFIFPLLKSPNACNSSSELVPKKTYSSSPFGVPSPQEWVNLWAAWDMITLRMIPPSMLFQKPIDLRHICLFYLGHIPTFLDIHLSRLLSEPHTDPVGFKDIFERGIDPNVDDPSQCHPHSEVPQNDKDWPSLNSISQFRSRVRNRLLKLYNDFDNGNLTLTRKMGRVLFMTFEHEALHAETLLYMLLQRAGSGTIPPHGFAIPEWNSLASSWKSIPPLVEDTVTLGPAVVELGHDDAEGEDELKDYKFNVEDREFGWDNEHPKRHIDVQEFRISWRPITNGQYYDTFKKNKDKFHVPASWVEEDGEIRVRTLYGPVPLSVAEDWPIFASYDDLSTYATVKGGRLPTEPELRLFYDKFQCGFEGGANLGFRNWHPVPATTGGKQNGGKGHNGGVWEWTSTEFDKYDGFTPSKLYPGYSMDFFDGAHQVVIGGSYATIPRIAERRSLRNWYQRNYPFAWVGARVVYDA